MQIPGQVAGFHRGFTGGSAGNDKETEPAIARAEALLERLGCFDAIRRYCESREMVIHNKVIRLTGARVEGMERKAPGFNYSNSIRLTITSKRKKCPL